ncbi:MAG: hypothetical protein HN948_00905 [Clostridia bacterium]|jgi:hypothetical protein|nr:hypothetical protein [Clostridia bacterium]MBT7121548.1 hypothetical protein [Clostridia bacterium]
MKISVLPKSKLGIWSVALLIFSVLLVVLFFLLINVFNQKGGETFFSNLTLTIPMICAWFAGVLSFIIGIIAVIKNKSRSMLVFISILIGFLVALYGILAVTPS